MYNNASLIWRKAASNKDNREDLWLYPGATSTKVIIVKLIYLFQQGLYQVSIFL